MINPVSSQAPVSAPQSQPSKAQQAPTPAASSQAPDSVHLSAQAKAALSGDADHDGDSH